MRMINLFTLPLHWIHPARQRRAGRTARWSIDVDPAGFTLLELLISIFIFSIVVTTLFASHATVFRSAPAISESLDLYRMAGTCLQRMTIDLMSLRLTLPPAYKKPDFDADPDPYRLVGDLSPTRENRFHRLRFASLAHIPPKGSRREGVAEIVYYVSRRDDGTHVLKRADDLYPYEPFEEHAGDPVLCENVHALAFTYTDDEGETTDFWDSETEEFDHATPRSITIVLDIEMEGKISRFQTVVPLPIARDPLDEDG